MVARKSGWTFGVAGGPEGDPAPPKVPNRHFIVMRKIRGARGMDHVVKLVLLILETYADNFTGKSYPSISTLAEDCGVSARSVRYAIQAARRDGWLTVLRGQHPHDARGNVYIVTPTRDPPMIRGSAKSQKRADPDGPTSNR